MKIDDRKFFFAKIKSHIKSFRAFHSGMCTVEKYLGHWSVSKRRRKITKQKFCFAKLASEKACLCLVHGSSMAFPSPSKGKVKFGVSCAHRGDGGFPEGLICPPEVSLRMHLIHHAEQKSALTAALLALSPLLTLPNLLHFVKVEG